MPSLLATALSAFSTVRNSAMQVVYDWSQPTQASKSSARISLQTITYAISKLTHWQLHREDSSYALACLSLLLSTHNRGFRITSRNVDMSYFVELYAPRLLLTTASSRKSLLRLRLLPLQTPKSQIWPKHTMPEQQLWLCIEVRRIASHRCLWACSSLSALSS